MLKSSRSASFRDKPWFQMKINLNIKNWIHFSLLIYCTMKCLKKLLQKRYHNCVVDIEWRREWVHTTYPERQLQVGTLFITSHLVFDPHGEGLHSSAGMNTSKNTQHTHLVRAGIQFSSAAENEETAVNLSITESEFNFNLRNSHSEWHSQIWCLGTGNN